MDPHDVLGCPYCQAALHVSQDAATSWQCRGCGQRFASQGQIPVLLRREDADRLAAFSRQHRQARLGEGWQPLTQEQAFALPEGCPPGFPALYWQVRRQSFGALMDILAGEGPPLTRGLGTDG